MGPPCGGGTPSWPGVAAGEGPSVSSPARSSGWMPGYPRTTPCGEPTCPSPPSGSGSGGWRLWRDSGTQGFDVHTGRASPGRFGDLVCFAGRGPGEVFHGARKVVGLSQWRAREGALFSSCAYLRWDPAPLLALIHLDPPRPRGTDARPEDGGGGSRRARPGGRGPRSPARAAARLVRTPSAPARGVARPVRPLAVVFLSFVSFLLLFAHPLRSSSLRAGSRSLRVLSARTVPGDGLDAGSAAPVGRERARVAAAAHPAVAALGGGRGAGRGLHLGCRGAEVVV